MTDREKLLLGTVCGDAEPRLCVRSEHKIDAGRWWRRTPLWVCVTDSHLLVLAVGRRRYIENVPLAECRESRYCHASGELVLAPVENVQFARIRMKPRDALAVMKAIGV